MIAVKANRDTPHVDRYPYIGITGDADTEIIVLFERHDEGTVIYSVGLYPIGHYSTFWVEDTFTPYDGKITLENE